MVVESLIQARNKPGASWSAAASLSSLPRGDERRRQAGSSGSIPRRIEVATTNDCVQQQHLTACTTTTDSRLSVESCLDSRCKNTTYPGYDFLYNSRINVGAGEGLHFYYSLLFNYFFSFQLAGRKLGYRLARKLRGK